MKDIDQLPKLYIRGLIAPKGSVFNLFGGPEQETFSAADAISWLESHPDADEFVIDVSSDGGYKGEGVEIYNILKNSGRTIYGIGRKVNSIATVIFLSAEKRYVLRDADFVVHFARIDPRDLGSEPLTAEDLQKLTDETERVDAQLVDIYCRELGEDKRNQLVAAMGAELNLGAKGAIKLGFAHGYFEKKQTVADSKSKNFACIALNNFEADLLTKKLMNTKQDDRLSAIEKSMATFRSFLNRILKVKNQVTLTLSDGTFIYVEVADPAAPDVLKGGTAYLADETGLSTGEKLKDGDYTLEDGRVLSVVDGIVTEEKPATVDKDKDDKKADLSAKEAEIAALKEQIAAKDTELTALKAASTASQASVTELGNKFAALQTQFTNYKKQVPGDKAADDVDDNKPAGGKDWAKMSRTEKIYAMAADRRREMKLQTNDK